MKSIIQTEKRCFLCGRNGYVEPLDKHHVFGGGLRAKSERYGLTVWLCHNTCHEVGKRAVHVCKESNRFIQAEAQKRAMERYGWSTEDFIREFYRNYL